LICWRSFAGPAGAGERAPLAGFQNVQADERASGIGREGVGWKGAAAGRLAPLINYCRHYRIADATRRRRRLVVGAASANQINTRAAGGSSVRRHEIENRRWARRSKSAHECLRWRRNSSGRVSFSLNNQCARFDVVVVATSLFWADESGLQTVAAVARGLQRLPLIRFGGWRGRVRLRRRLRRAAELPFLGNFLGVGMEKQRIVFHNQVQSRRLAASPPRPSRASLTPAAAVVVLFRRRHRRCGVAASRDEQLVSKSAHSLAAANYRPRAIITTTPAPSSLPHNSSLAAGSH
jgi:hypothetical protein